MMTIGGVVTCVDAAGRACGRKFLPQVLIRRDLVFGRVPERVLVLWWRGWPWPVLSTQKGKGPGSGAPGLSLFLDRPWIRGQDE